MAKKRFTAETIIRKLREAEVLQRQGEAVHVLPQQTQQVVAAAGPPPWVLQHLGDRCGQAEAPIRLLQQQYATIGGDVAALETGLHHTALTGWKLKRFLGTVCHGQNLSDIGLKPLNYIEFLEVLPFYL